MRDFVWDGKSDEATYKGELVTVSGHREHTDHTGKSLLAFLEDNLRNGTKPVGSFQVIHAEKILQYYEEMEPPIEMSALSLANSLPVKELGELA